MGAITDEKGRFEQNGVITSKMAKGDPDNNKLDQNNPASQRYDVCI
jgi:hypothetical protein